MRKEIMVNKDIISMKKFLITIIYNLIPSYYPHTYKSFFYMCDGRLAFIFIRIKFLYIEIRIAKDLHPCYKTQIYLVR